MSNYKFVFLYIILISSLSLNLFYLHNNNQDLSSKKRVLHLTKYINEYSRLNFSVCTKNPIDFINRKGIYLFVPEQACNTCVNEMIRISQDGERKQKISIVLESKLYDYYPKSIERINLDKKKWPIYNSEIPYILFLNKKGEVRGCYIYDSNTVFVLRDLIKENKDAI